MCGKLENVRGLHQREPLNQGHLTLTISPKNSWHCHALRFTWESNHMILDLSIQAQEEPWSTAILALHLKHETSLTNMPYGESLSSRNCPTEEFMSLDLLSQWNHWQMQIKYFIHTVTVPLRSRRHLQQNTLRRGLRFQSQNEPAV